MARSDRHRSWGGIIVGGILSAMCVVGGIWLVYLGHDGAGATIATAAVAALAGVFVYGTSSKRKERAEKTRVMRGK